MANSQLMTTTVCWLAELAEMTPDHEVALRACAWSRSLRMPMHLSAAVPVWLSTLTMFNLLLNFIMHSKNCYILNYRLVND